MCSPQSHLYTRTILPVFGFMRLCTICRVQARHVGQRTRFWSSGCDRCSRVCGSLSPISEHRKQRAIRRSPRLEVNRILPAALVQGCSGSVLRFGAHFVADTTKALHPPSALCRQSLILSGQSLAIGDSEFGTFEEGRQVIHGESPAN